MEEQEDGAFAEPSLSGDQIRDEIPAVTVNVITVAKLAENYKFFYRGLQSYTYSSR